MTNVRERLNRDEKFTFVREVGKKWHVAQPNSQLEGVRAECAVQMKGPYTRKKELEWSDRLPSTDLCKRNGCKDAFDYLHRVTL